MSNQMILYIMGGSAVTLVIIVLIYFILSKKMQGSEYRKIQKLQQGTKQKSFSTEVLFQKLYLTYIKIPFIKRYALKIRRRLEIINIDDEYNTRKGTAKILTRTLAIVVPVMILTIMISSKNFLLMFILLLFELFMIDTLIDGSVDKIDNKILKEQIDFFSEIRHAYHEYNMVEEAIYQVSQDDEKDVSRQGEKIYEILISDDPEMELEKYYDIAAPNSFLKEFAGVSYLTKEFGDRKVDGASLYLKNVNNITQEMQLEILKRDKLNYVFQSLSVIAIAPVLLLEPLKNWAISNFSFTASWYQGKAGMIVQMLILLITFVSYVLVRKLKDNGSTAIDTRTENPWQEKLYKKKPIKKIVDLFIPKKGTKEYRKVVQLLKDAASPQKMEWLFMNRIAIAIVTFCASIIIFTQLHVVAINYIYTEPTTDYNIIGGLSEKDEKKAMEITKQDNIILDQYRGKPKTTQEQIKTSVQKLKYYEGAESTEIDKAAERIYNKLHVINTEYVQWFELLLAFVFAVIGYMAPLWILVFQAKMRQLEMEDEVMQFQTIILMLMRIERVNVEIILEWLERYSNIFKAPITKCVNNYEAGAWESLEAMKEEVNYVPMIRIIESLQAAVEKIPITDAFDELDSERDYYQEKRKESNERLIKRKGMIGKAIGFAPMVCLFVGYLIIPLVFIGLTSMSSSFSSMTATTTK